MFTTIAKVFGKSPFRPLRFHMEKVSFCIDKLSQLLPLLKEEKREDILALSKEISLLEHEADLTKDDIRSHLPSTIFMPIDRTTILNILTMQDSFADKAEDIAIALTFRPLDNYEQIREEFENFFQKNIETFFLAKQVIDEFDTLLETSFGGNEAEKVRAMVNDLAYKEHELDRQQYRFIHKFYNENLTHDYKGFDLWLRILQEVGSISNLSEKLGNHVRMILELK